jgi:hypothetical protein
MSGGPGLYGVSVRLVAGAMILLGLVICVRTISLGGGPLSFGLIVGLALVGIGAGRLWLARRMGPR